MTVQARYRLIAEELRAAVRQGEYRDGGRLPSEEGLAQQYGVSRGTVRQALAVLRAEGTVTSRRGTRRVALESPPLHDFAELLSFSRWARSQGLEPGSRTVRQEWHPAAPEEAAQLRLPLGAQLFRVVRLRLLDGRPAMVERTAYPQAVGELVAPLPADTVSVTEQLERVGVLLTDADHTVDLTVADPQDAELLGCAPGAALLRERRRTTDPAGAPVEWSEDRYLPGVMAFTVHSSRAVPGLGRHSADGP
ncbi:GntR family transcriptional regulator [Streptacidiphilus sp. N1-3]|uniref:GntR family transcriptional regulator n=1 Tax=Streptacidiphilus alkalitolerans TaxID=3342712 RepID=A0ABV6X193_9ACTN